MTQSEMGKTETDDWTPPHRPIDEQMRPSSARTPIFAFGDASAVSTSCYFTQIRDISWLIVAQ